MLSNGSFIVVGFLDRRCGELDALNAGDVESLIGKSMMFVIGGKLC